MGKCTLTAMKTFNVKIPEDLHKRFKLACVHEEREMSEVVRKAIEDFVEKSERKLKSK
jgi:metal-responsive CopG/Arc/MetJ family transcriptional regulator